MPIYEYRCRSCGFEKEYLQKLSDAPVTDCPNCGKPEMGKLVSAAGFQLKGTGWYATDFKNGSRPAQADSAESQSKPGQADSTEKKPESKPEKKPESKPEKAEAAPACGAGACPACQ